MAANRMLCWLAQALDDLAERLQRIASYVDARNNPNQRGAA